MKIDGIAADDEQVILAARPRVERIAQTIAQEVDRHDRGWRSGPCRGRHCHRCAYCSPFDQRSARPEVGRYAGFSQTDTCCLLSLLKGSQFQSLQRSRKVSPASRAMRSSSDGHT